MTVDRDSLVRSCSFVATLLAVWVAQGAVHAQEAAPTTQPAAPTEAPPAEGPVATPPADAPAPPTQTAPEAAPGSLEVATGLPGAAVSLDGQPAGMTPLRLDGIASGRHSVRIELEGLPPIDREVTVQPGVVVKIEAAMELAPPPAAEPATAEPAPPAPRGPSTLHKALSIAQAIPWSLMALGVAAISLFAWAVLYSTAPGVIPGFDTARLPVSSPAWRVVQAVPLVTAIVFAVVGAGLFFVPALPLPD